MTKRIQLMAAILWALAGEATATALIDTTSSTFFPLSAFGDGGNNTETFGQTFTVTGPETQLNNFSFRFNDSLSLSLPDFVDFAAYVYAWDGFKATGPQLFASTGMSSSNNGGLNGFEVFSINTSGIQLTAGQQYVAFFSTSLFSDGSPGSSGWELSGSDVYTGGEFVYYHNGTNFGSLTTNAWNCNSNNNCHFGEDLWFIANFSEAGSAPEPATLALIGLGFAGLRLSRRERT